MIGQLQCLNARQHRRKTWIEYVVAPFDGVRQMHRPHARLPRHAVQLLQRQFGVENRQLHADDKAVRIFLVNLNARVVDDLREMRALLRG